MKDVTIIKTLRCDMKSITVKVGSYYFINVMTDYFGKVMNLGIEDG